jgi:hypothetical protein
VYISFLELGDNTRGYPYEEDTNVDRARGGGRVGTAFASETHKSRRGKEKKEIGTNLLKGISILGCMETISCLPITRLM